MTDVHSKAATFSELHKKPTGWYLAWLVVSSSAPAKPGRRSKNVSQDTNSDKVSLTEFAEMADVSHTTVARYYRAWELAADAGQVPPAKDVENTEDWDDLLVDWGFDEFDDQEDIEQHWTHWYTQAKLGTKTQAEIAAEAAKAKREASKKVKEKALLEDDEPVSSKTQTQSNTQQDDDPFEEELPTNRDKRTTGTSAPKNQSNTRHPAEIWLDTLRTVGSLFSTLEEGDEDYDEDQLELMGKELEELNARWEAFMAARRSR